MAESNIVDGLRQETPFTTQYQRTFGIWASNLFGELVREREGV
jgi:hypothetical protein